MVNKKTLTGFKPADNTLQSTPCLFSKYVLDCFKVLF